MKCVSKLFKTTKKAKPSPSSPLPVGLCRQFLVAKMKIATNNFDANLVIGEGDFGTLYKGSFNDCNSTRIVAIKRMKLNEDLRNEVVFVCQLHHPNLISLIGYCIDEGVNILVYEFLINGIHFRELHDRLSFYWTRIGRPSCQISCCPTCFPRVSNSWKSNGIRKLL